MRRMRPFGFLIGLVAVLALALPAGQAGASHSWNGYHWARQSNPFTLTLLDSVTSTWDTTLGTTSSDWSSSDVLNTTVAGSSTISSTRKRCPAVSGKVRVCNAAYGQNGWLGVAQVWVSGSHIAMGTVKLNDTYFGTATYNTSAWRNLVSCQEVGHTLGLDHQDENFSNPNLNTCMDYTSDPTSNQHPNKHDYDELDTIYAHLDGTTTVSAQTSSRGLADEAGSGPPDWGDVVRSDEHGRPILFAKNLGRGRHLLTWVDWEPTAPAT